MTLLEALLKWWSGRPKRAVCDCCGRRFWYVRPGLRGGRPGRPVFWCTEACMCQAMGWDPAE